MFIPNFFLVGAPRCATTSLYTYLKQHPDIYLSVLKEPHFFSSDLTRPPQATVDKEVYLDLFSDARNEKCLGEGSVWYLESATAPDEIRKFSPAARIIIMLRNPIDMACSLHGLYLRTGNEDLEDFEAALAAQQDRKRGEGIPATTYFPEGLQYTEVAKYSAKVERYLRVFGQERVHTIIFDDFAEDTPRAYRRVLEFLDVDPAFDPEFDLEKAAAKLRLTAIRQLRRIPTEIKRKMRGANDTHRGVRRKPLEPRLRSRLREEFSTDIERLGELLGRDFSHWR